MRMRGLLHATDFQSLMYPCFTFSRFIGIFPYKIDGSTFIVSKPSYFMSTVITCVYCFVYLLFIHAVLFSGTMTSRGIIQTLQAVFYFTLSGLIVISTHILSIRRMRLIQSIMEISSKLSSESYQKLSKWIHVKDIVGPISILMEGWFYFRKTEWNELNYGHYLAMVFWVYMALLLFQMNMLYINCVCILKACLKKINAELMQIQRFANNMKPSIPNVICNVLGNQFIMIKLKTLMKQHLMINKIVKTLNLIFSLPLLIIIIQCFNEITFEIYFHVVHWQGEVLISIDENVLDFFLTTMMHHIINITLLVWACETGKNQAEKISTNICDIFNSTRNEEIKAELRLFSLQVLHCDNTFWAKGLTIDATLLAEIVGSITTYLLILIQFLIVSHSCDEKSGSRITNNLIT